VRLALHLVRGLTIAAVWFPFQTPERHRCEIELWSRRLLAILGVRLSLSGPRKRDSERPLMLVANHVSWLDIFLIDAVMASRFVAKAEVRRWPVLGWLCARVGTFFIERAKRHDTARVNDAAGAALRAGEVVAVFPEGTTTDGSHVLKFHASLLAPALEAGADVQPVALRYERHDGSLCTEAAYDGERSLWDALIGIVSEPEVVARVCFLKPMSAAGNHRRDIAHRAREAILLTLVPRAHDNRTHRASGHRVSAR
jgi:1-acyl-sn-glycerol-3-phosphate acyltransferase